MIEQYITQFLPSDWHHISWKYKDAKIDAHTHLHFSEGMDVTNVLRIADAYNIKHILGIVDSDVRVQINDLFGDRFILAKFLRSQSLLTQDAHLLGEMVDEIYSQGYSMVKFWFAPRWKDYVKNEFKVDNVDFGLQDARFTPIFERIEDLGLKFLIHISDPDLWYEKKYQPASFYGTKEQHLADLEHVIAKYPKIPFQIAHFGAQPEHFDNLGRWFDTYPNVFVDMSSARWMARELSRDVERSRDFIQKYQDRIFWGTDLSFGWTRGDSPEEYFITRYLTFHALLETNAKNLVLPFPDPENESQTMINGLDLPYSVLRKLYWENARKYHGL